MKIGLLTDDKISKFRLNTLIPILRDENLSIKLAIIDKRPKQTILQKNKKTLNKRKGRIYFYNGI